MATKNMQIAIFLTCLTTCVIAGYIAYRLYTIEKGLKSSFHEWVDILSDFEIIATGGYSTACWSVQLIDTSQNTVLIDSKTNINRETLIQASYHWIDLAKQNKLRVQLALTGCEQANPVNPLQDLVDNVNKKLARFANLYKN
jgi:hypothetical protein